MQLDKGGYMDGSMIRPLRGRGSPLYCSPACGTKGGGPAGRAGCVEGLCRKVRRKGSKGKVDGAFGPEGCGRLTAAGCVRFAQGATAAVPQRVVEAPYGRNIKSALRDLHLCHYGSPVISSGGTSRYGAIVSWSR